uniref:Uncharacterized protein n=1 Tax=Arundo donax TaxID=35708 RepID=A0A0A9GIS7_ARUDO
MTKLYFIQSCFHFINLVMIFHANIASLFVLCIKCLKKLR